MALYYDRNAAQEEGSALIPDMPGYSDFKDKPFKKMVTEQDQIWWLYWHFAKLVNDTRLNTIDDRLTKLEEQVAKNTDDIADIKDDIAELRRWICHLATNALTYDVTRGMFAASIAESRRTWQAHHFHSMTVADMATFTVAEVAKMEIRHMAVDGRTVYMQDDTENDVADQFGYECAYFNPDEYVRKSDLTLIDTDNLEDHTIMGVLEKDAATDYPDWIPYMRPYTAADLNNSWVLFSDHVIAPMDKE